MGTAETYGMSTQYPRQWESKSVRRVLVIDDDPTFCDLARLLLLSEDMQVVALANSGEDAMGLLADTRPDVAVVDMQMPGWNGLETAQRLRAADPRLCVVLTSADDALVYRDLAGVYGAAFVPKKGLTPAAIANLC